MQRYQWDGGHVRGIDVIRVRDSKIGAKLSHVKGHRVGIDIAVSPAIHA